MNTSISQLPAYAELEIKSRSATDALPSFYRGQKSERYRPYIIPTRRCRLRALKDRMKRGNPDENDLLSAERPDTANSIVARSRVEVAIQRVTDVLDEEDDKPSHLLVALSELEQVVEDRIYTLTCPEERVNGDLAPN